MGTHVEHEDHPWSREILDHPARKDSPEYVKSRKKMRELLDSAPVVRDLYFRTGEMRR